MCMFDCMAIGRARRHFIPIVLLLRLSCCPRLEYGYGDHGGLSLMSNGCLLCLLGWELNARSIGFDHHCAALRRLDPLLFSGSLALTAQAGSGRQESKRETLNWFGTKTTPRNPKRGRERERGRTLNVGPRNMNLSTSKIEASGPLASLVLKSQDLKWTPRTPKERQFDSFLSAALMGTCWPGPCRKSQRFRFEAYSGMFLVKEPRELGDFDRRVF